MNETQPRPEHRTALATRIIQEITAQLAQENDNIKGIVGFGSFWSFEIGRLPKDIDLAVYCDNENTFRFEEKQRLVDALAQHFPYPPEFHLLSPYTPSMGHELENYKILLENATPIWGEMPNWLESDQNLAVAR